jgi:superfamily II DNA/RNA helicase
LSEALKTYKPADNTFASFPEITTATANKLTQRGIKDLFPIQSNSFYPVYNFEDIIARDLTGSGKTLAFALPIVERLRKQKLLGTRRI